MFVFVTANSLSSNWIYFETGYAYSKGIDVIPVGIGVDIGKIPPPLNLLQGFNTISEDSLNNIISIINKKFSYSFKESFTQQEYESFNNSDEKFKLQLAWNKIVENVNSSIFSYTDSNHEKILVDMLNVFDNISNYLVESKCKMSIESKVRSILIHGLELRYLNDKIIINISSYGFQQVYKIFNDILKISYSKKDTHYIHIELNQLFGLVASNVKISSIISQDILFSLDENSIGHYSFKDVRFFIFKKDIPPKISLKEEYQLGIVFKVGETLIDVIYELVERLYNIGVIYER